MGTVAGVNGVPARLVHRRAQDALGPGLTAAGFTRLRGTSIAAYQRPVDDEFIVCWVQPSRSGDGFGWFGTSFTLEFRRGAKPVVGVSGRSFRFCNLISDEGREQVRRVQNDVIRRLPPAPKDVTAQLHGDTLAWYLAKGDPVTKPYNGREDVWFRHCDAADLAKWLELLVLLLPEALAEVQVRLG